MGQPEPNPQRSFVRTRDGWKLAVYRHVPTRPREGQAPVLLVHGLSANRYDLDAPIPEISLARYLCERGHDVWVVELRGSGRSRYPGWPLARRPGFDFDDYVHRDVPALLRHVLDQTGAAGLHWVGHSMGGMLAYAALEHYEQRLFRSVVTVGSPAFTAIKHPLVDVAYQLRFLLKMLDWLPSRRLAQAGSLLPWAILRRIMGVVGNPDNMDPDHVGPLLRGAIHDLPAPLLAQFAEWYGRQQGFGRQDGLLDYTEHLGRITVPLLVIAGAGDELTPLRDLHGVFNAISSPDKWLLVASRANGFRHDYGHIDLILGMHARIEIYPHVAEWIEKHR